MKDCGERRGSLGGPHLHEVPLAVPAACGGSTAEAHLLCTSSAFEKPGKRMQRGRELADGACPAGQDTSCDWERDKQGVHRRWSCGVGHKRAYSLCQEALDSLLADEAEDMARGSLLGKSACDRGEERMT